MQNNHKVQELFSIEGKVTLVTGSYQGLGLVLGGFVPTPLEHITEYYPTAIELGVTAGVWATGFFILTILYKVAISVKLESEKTA